MENNFTNFADMVSNDENLQPIMDAIEQIMAIPEDSLNNENIDVMIGMSLQRLRLRKQLMN